MRGLEGKRALVTGAGRLRGIGRAIALRLAEEGAHVAVAGFARNPGTFPEHEQSVGWLGVASVAEEIEAIGQTSVAVEGDVSNPGDVEALVESTVSVLGGVDILVNNAALPSEAGVAPILDMDEALWFRTVDVNLNGLYLVTRDVGRVMRDQGGGGAIVNISSLAGRMGLPAYGGYTATKWAMIGLTQQLAHELANDRIRVNCVCPGSTDTDMMDGTFRRSAEQAGRDFDTWKQRTAASVPWGRQGTPEEQAAAVAFLASEDASYITGQTINVDGGLRMD